MTSSAERTALVTGTSSGIGLHTAVGLARAGLRVVATVRDPARADGLRAAAAAAGVDVDVVALEVTDAGRRGFRDTFAVTLDTDGGGSGS